MPFFQSLRQGMTHFYASKLGEVTLFGHRNIKVQVGIPPGMAWEMRGVVVEAITQHQLKLGGVTPRVTVEDSPTESIKKICVGRTMGAIKDALAQGGGSDAGWTAVPQWRPSTSVNLTHASHGPLEVRQIKDGKPIFSEDTCTKVLKMTSGDLDRLYTENAR